MKAIRQGDVMLIPAKIPAGAKRIELRPLALGEATGHHHSLAAAGGMVLEDCAQMFECGEDTFVRVTEEGISLVHQEHHPHAIEPGEARVVRQVENSDWGARPVVD